MEQSSDRREGDEENASRRTTEDTGEEFRYFDRFDIVAAHYVFYALHHEGQASERYARLSRISRYFKPRASRLDLEQREWANARTIYRKLCRRHGEDVECPARL